MAPITTINVLPVTAKPAITAKPAKLSPGHKAISNAIRSIEANIKALGDRDMAAKLALLTAIIGLRKSMQPADTANPPAAPQTTASPVLDKPAAPSDKPLTAAEHNLRAAAIRAAAKAIPVPLTPNHPFNSDAHAHNLRAAILRAEMKAKEIR